MRIKSITLNKIKSFEKKTTFDFSESDKINTISGINGSGKTTVFKSMILAQKLYFSKTYVITLNNNEELLNFFNEVGSYIIIEFEFADNSTSSFTLNCALRNKEKVKINLVINENDKEKINGFWNFDNPKNLIIYIDSNRNISEEDFSNEDIKLTNNDTNSLIIDYIIQPDKLFFNTYERLIRDYIRERIIPSTPRTDLPHFTSKILIHNILDYLEFSNFTSLERKNQFILQVKRGNVKKKHTYDVRNLSSGEKTLFYIFHFICYVKSIGMLIIDEPENNLHEEMLSKFVNLLYEITHEEKFSNLILKKAKIIKQPISENINKQITNFYKDHTLSQTFLLTHSKNLIYNNFTIGKNFIIEDGISLIDYENHEKLLRNIGLSKIINKVLFVEGKTENEILEKIFSPLNIKIKNLNGSSEVIETYRKYYSFHNHIRDVQFCFLIDKDTRTEYEIEDMRKNDSLFFDEHFIIMNKHEIENYLLDSKLIHNLFKIHNNLNKDIKVPLENEIEKKIKEIADSNKEHVFRKSIQNLNQNSLHKIKLAVSTKSIEVLNKTAYNKYIESVFDSKSITETIEILKNNFSRIDEINNNWEKDWKDLCDGKIVLNQLKTHLAKELGLTAPRVINELINSAQESKSHDFNLLIQKIKLLYN
ncbi:MULTISPECIES: AAA family ATPase [Flavobacterium]|uniref:AAA family ATPase n=1 Tax=Flavobacterium TaxID=237 RepID=UPI0006AB9EFC|nr:MULTISPECIES: AAA family ATPase [Flavobacterium]KOP39911.1 hypothetical protein AKO67_01285 [Flavobacterium sp. VMW]OWU88563.1 hypothetical protein APR43_22345 [Flavobacterium sp. NLM]UUF13908.1 AAA family ATPase [Flavobacterium panici]